MYNPDTLMSLIHRLAEKLEIKQLEDWRRVSIAQIDRVEPTTITRNIRGFPKVLESVYLEHNWNWSYYYFHRTAFKGSDSIFVSKIRYSSDY